jgi:hypothetical protein
LATVTATSAVAILNALEEYITAREAGPARLELGERNYVMDPEQPGVDAPEPQASLTTSHGLRAIWLK